jgi:hypothetical protein
MDQLIHIEVLGRQGEVAHRHAARALPIRIGRAYDNDLILEDPYAAPHHAVVERTPAGELELVDAGSRNGLFRAGAKHRLARERVDPAARYRAGKTEFRVRSGAHPVAEERIDRPAGALREPLAAALAVLALVGILFFEAWSGTDERTELAKLAVTPVLAMLALFIWAGAWGLAGRLLTGHHRFAAHLMTAALVLIGIFAADGLDYVAYAFSAPEAAGLAAIAAVGALLAWGLWRHLALALRNPGRSAAIAAVTVAATCLGVFGLFIDLQRDDGAVHMAYLKAVKPPAVRLVKGRESGQFLRDAGCSRASSRRCRQSDISARRAVTACRKGSFSGQLVQFLLNKGFVVPQSCPEK